MALDMTTFDPFLKQLYTDKRIKNLVYTNNPLLAMMEKDENFVGKNKPIPITYGIPQGRSATFANAQANVSNSQQSDFVLTRVKDYSIAEIDNETIEASKTDMGAFAEASAYEIDNAIKSLTRSLAISMYRNGSGSIGQIANSSPTTALTLVNIEEITNFEIGQVLQLSTADGGGSLKTGTTTVTAVNRTTGVVTVGTSVATFTAAGAANDYIFVQGDYDLKVSGLDAWIPTTDPTSTLFFGVNRAVDTVRLGGVRSNGAGAPVREAIIDGARLLAREGGSPDKAFCNYTVWSNLEKDMSSSVQFVDLTVDGLVGFTGIRINGPDGPIDVVPDRNCPTDRIYLLQMDTWKLNSLGKAPSIFKGDGLPYLRQSGADGIEVRAYYYAQVGCNAPGWNAVITL